MWSKKRVKQFLGRQTDPDFLLIDEWERYVLNKWLGKLLITSLLDIPCGYGRFFDIWVNYANNVVAIDSSPEMCEKARNYARKLRLDATVIEGEILQTVKYETDVSVCVRLWTHIRDGTIADKFLDRLLTSSPYLILQINESNLSPESIKLHLTGKYRLDSIKRIANFLKKKGGRIHAVERFRSTESTMTYLLIKRHNTLSRSILVNGVS